MSFEVQGCGNQVKNVNFQLFQFQYIYCQFKTSINLLFGIKSLIVLLGETQHKLATPEDKQFHI